MTTKHIFDTSDGLVVKSLRGAVALNPSLKFHSASKSVYVSSRSPSTRVAVISGGGAGHEPAHASYTGRGMLAACVSGDIFASPSAKQILNTIKFAAFEGSDPTNAASTASKAKDVLIVINNYTGDRLNFGLAIEKARSRFPDVQVESVVVADDVSLLRPASRASMVGPRGLAGNILVCKILGAFAERGESLARIRILGDAVVDNLASIGVGLEHCHIPGRVRSKGGTDETVGLGERECEIGLGLHNEPGVKRKEMGSPQALIAEMLEMILASKDITPEGRTVDELAGFIRPGGTEDVVVFVNNLGGVSQLEMGAVTDEIINQLEELKVYPVRIYLSSYMTSLNAPGFSISILNVSAVRRTFEGRVKITPNGMDVLQLLDDPTEALAWVGVRSSWPKHGSTRASKKEAEEELEAENFLRSFEPVGEGNGRQPDGGWDWWRSADISPEAVKNGIEGACQAILNVSSDMTWFDTVVGDGDCGETFAAGARAIQSLVENGSLEVGSMSPSLLVGTLGEVLEDTMGGTIGALFAIFFTAWSASLRDVSSISWSGALQSGLEALSRHTPARPGDRTIIDALDPLCSAFVAGKGIRDATRAAREGADSTKGMKARLGRAVYIGDDESKGELPPDPGAWGIAAIAEGFCSGYSR